MRVNSIETLTQFNPLVPPPRLSVTNNDSKVDVKGSTPIHHTSIHPTSASRGVRGGAVRPALYRGSSLRGSYRGSSRGTYRGIRASASRGPGRGGATSNVVFRKRGTPHPNPDIILGASKKVIYTNEVNKDIFMST